MKPYGDKNYLKKKDSYESKKNLPLINLKFFNKIFDTVNISLLLLVFIYTFLSLNSQRKWSKTYVNLSKTRDRNNNLIDYISKTEEFYINKLDSLSYLKKTTPKDLVYLEKISPKKENLLDNKIKIIVSGLKASRYQIGY